MSQGSGGHGPGRQPYGHAGGEGRVVLGDHVFELPAFYHRVDCFFSGHLASYDAVRDLLPSREIQPVRWFDGRAAIEVVVLRYGDVTGLVDGEVGRLTPYAEVSVCAAVSRHPVPPGAALLASEHFRIGSFVLDMPVTTVEARDLGREAFGYPKFVADMDFLDSPTRQAVTVSEAGELMLSLAVRAGGRLVRVRRPWVLYSALGGALLETHVPTTGWRHGRSGSRAAELVLGDHPVARRLHDLGTDTRSLVSSTYLGLRLILPAGHPVGTATPWPGHAGSSGTAGPGGVDGRFTVDHGGTGPLDQAVRALEARGEPVRS